MIPGDRTSCLATAPRGTRQGPEGGPRLPRAVHVDVRLHERRPDARGEADADAAVLLREVRAATRDAGDEEEDGAMPIRQPRRGREAKPMRQPEEVYLLFAASSFLG